MDRVGAIVIGAGIVGLACARALAARGIETLILERSAAIGEGVSSRSSEVIHSGIYYAEGSRKAQLCVRGREALYDYCRAKQLPHRQLGKLVVATDEAQLQDLETLRARAIANGVRDVELITRHRALEMEPELLCSAALYCPATGIVDSHALMQALLADAEASGALLVRKALVSAGEVTGQAIRLDVDSGSATQVEAERVVNAAGLNAISVAGQIKGYPCERSPSAFFAKGHYFSLSGRSPFNRLVYPLPTPAGLGIHLTLDMGGHARFGPDVEWVSAPSYSVDPAREPGFRTEIARYWPGIQARKLMPAYAGVRPKIVGPAEKPGDFMIQGPTTHGVPGLVNLFGIESPGLTACLAVAEVVADTIE